MHELLESKAFGFVSAIFQEMLIPVNAVPKLHSDLRLQGSLSAVCKF